ncbi:hypothetical protein BDQ12DRAFT_709744 [Crucibulum laeve]|uniref:SHSP domain-containing protein n=1 Tax=Crucibulum laeve TaxID=68775 RepID=A0A5C3MCK5_9AGAR|nr:hypothetical protein BDQ12DRAFT_709744 [Crucibulum laeve]
MSVFYYEPFYDFDRFLDQALSPNSNNNASGKQVQHRLGERDGAVLVLKPRMDLHEDFEQNIVTATFELPGISKEDAFEFKISAEHDEGRYAIRERRFGNFSRTIQPLEGVKPQQIKAKIECGILTVTFPKSAPESAPKKISVN